MADARYPIFPTFMALTAMKSRLKGAVKGHSLLKKKSDALTVRFREILAKIVKNKELMGSLMKDATFSLASAKYAAGDFGAMVREHVNEATIKVRMGTENAMGVKLPVFEQTSEPALDGQELTGLARGGQRIKTCRDTYVKSLEGLIKLASLQTSFVTLDNAIRQTNRRVNALEYVIQPKIRNTIRYIQSELDERDREEFFSFEKSARQEETRHRSTERRNGSAHEVARRRRRQCR
mmetsp:Transcript_22966/g.39075  ORF Transcript_22966/g.39075 Transcript_22966/m.39075 type:complete len:236 (+) Transcript_22966:37-744(+)